MIQEICHHAHDCKNYDEMNEICNEDGRAMLYCGIAKHWNDRPETHKASLR